MCPVSPDSYPRALPTAHHLSVPQLLPASSQPSHHGRGRVKSCLERPLEAGSRQRAVPAGACRWLCESREQSWSQGLPADAAAQTRPLTSLPSQSLGSEGNPISEEWGARRQEDGAEQGLGRGASPSPRTWRAGLRRRAGHRAEKVARMPPLLGRKPKQLILIKTKQPDTVHYSKT